MSNSIHLISLLLLASGLSIQAQEKRAMTFDEMVGWERISEQRISDNGKWVFCKMEPWRGDATILLYNDKGEEKGSFKPAAKAQFSSSSEYLLVTKTPPLKEVEAEKLKKTDKDKMPMNSLIISRLSGGMETIDSLKSYKLSETADWLAYQRGSKKDSMLYPVARRNATRLVPGSQRFRICPKREYVIRRIRLCPLYLHSSERK